MATGETGNRDYIPQICRVTSRPWFVQLEHAPTFLAPRRMVRMERWRQSNIRGLTKYNLLILGLPSIRFIRVSSEKDVTSAETRK